MLTNLEDVDQNDLFYNVYQEDNKITKYEKKKNQQVDRQHLETLLNKVLNVPRSFDMNDTSTENQALKDSVQKYLTKKFISYKLLTGVQEFIPTIEEIVSIWSYICLTKPKTIETRNLGKLTYTPLEHI